MFGALHHTHAGLLLIFKCSGEGKTNSGSLNSLSCLTTLFLFLNNAYSRAEAMCRVFFSHHFLGEGEGEKAHMLAGAASLGRGGGKEGRRAGEGRGLAVWPTGQTTPSPVRAKCTLE